MADKQEQERESTNELKASLRIRTAYFVCAIIILTVFIIAQFTCKLYGSDNVFHFFSFASTITSIILSVIAIIISFISVDSVDRKSTRLNSSQLQKSRIPSSAVTNNNE